MSVGLQIWVREQKPKMMAHTGRLADDYAEARGSLESQSVWEATREPSRMVSESPRRCYACGEPGHIVRNCLLKVTRDV